jgi:hypothetical protein
MAAMLRAQEFSAAFSGELTTPLTTHRDRLYSARDDEQSKDATREN